MASPDSQQKLAPVTYLFSARGEKAVEFDAAEPSGEPELDRVVSRPQPVERESTVKFVELDAPQSQSSATRSVWSEEAEPIAEAGSEADSADDRAAARAEKRAARAAQSASRDDGEFEPIQNVSLHALGRRGISINEMSELLLRRGFDADAVAVECDRLLGVGLLDDTLVAESLVRGLRDRKGLGRGAVAAELKRRKIDPLVIESILSEIDSSDDAQRAREIAVKRAPQLRNLDYATAQRRLSAFLMRKGYSSSVVSQAVSAALSGEVPRGGGPVFR